MPVIGGLILVIGLELVMGRLPDIKLVLRVAPLSAIAMLITFAATTQLPLHTAILIGVITSLVLYCVKASQSAQLVALQQTDDGGLAVVPVPDAVREQRGHRPALRGRRAVRRGGPHRRGVAEGGGLHQCRRRAEHAHAARRAVLGGDQGAAAVGG